MSPIIKRAKTSRVRTRLSLASVIVLALAAGLMWPFAASGSHPTPSLPLTAEIVNKLRADNCNPGVVIAQVAGIPPDRKVSGANNRYFGAGRDGAADPAEIAIWANADNDPRELTLDLSGQHNVINGNAVSRSHLKISSSESLYWHATEYGTRSAGKEAFDLSGQNNCFNAEPDQVPRNSAAPPSPAPGGTFAKPPDGFPFKAQFDPDGNGNVLEHFAPGSAAAAAAHALGEYYTCPLLANSSPVPPPLKCSSGKLETDNQSGKIRKGLYYVPGEVTLSASNQEAIVTIVSGSQMKVNGSVQGVGGQVEGGCFGPAGQARTVFTPYVGDLLFATHYILSPNSANSTNAEDAITIEGSKSCFKGIIVAVNGRTQLAGEQNSFTCPVMGDRVRLNGSKLYISNECFDEPDIDVTKTPDGTGVGGEIEAGDQATFTIKVKNTGAGTATNVRLTDTLPNGNLTWTLISGAGCDATLLANEDKLDCAIGTLVADQEVTFVVQSSATSSASHCVNLSNGKATLDNGFLEAGVLGDAIATATGPTGSTLTDNDPGHILIRCPDPTVEKTPDEGTAGNDVAAGQAAVFTITVTNPGNGGTASNVRLSDTLPGNNGLNWSITSGADQPPTGPPNGCEITTTAGVQTLACIFGDLPEGGSRTVVISSATTAANCGTINNTVTITADGDIDTTAPSNSDAGEIDVICGAIRILKNSLKDGQAVRNAGAVFAVDGPDANATADFSVTDANPAAGLDEDGDTGEICVDGLQPGATYSVTETSPPVGYGNDSSTKTAVAIAGECPNAAFAAANTASFSNPPLADLQVRFRDGGSGEAILDQPLDCNNVTGTDSSADTADWDDSLTIDDIKVTAATITVVCTIVIDP